jgi:hypothetical protein
MFLVVLAAVAFRLPFLILDWMDERYAVFFARALEHGGQALSLHMKMESAARDGNATRAADLLNRCDWHRNLQAKYDRASRHPWAPVWPDPPELTEDAMRAIRMRLTMRGMMVAVAILGLAMGVVIQAYRWRERSRYYDGRATLLELDARWERSQADWSGKQAERTWESLKRYQTDPAYRQKVERMTFAFGPGGYIARRDGFLAREEQATARSRRRADYYATLVAKYRRAARYPWLAVTPDPPEPE